MRGRTKLFAGIVIVLAFLAAAVFFWFFDWGHASVEKLSDLHGKSLEAVIAILGEPDQHLEYSMANSPGGEFRVELFNTYPPGDAKAAQARIRELQWHRARYHIAVWLHQVDGEWAVLDTCRWKEGVAF